MPSRLKKLLLRYYAAHRLLGQALRTACIVLLAGVLLAGCAGALAFRDGKEFLSQDKVVEGLAKLQEAMVHDPHNLEYKKAYLQARERAVYVYLTQADRAAESGKRSDAERLYQRVLAIDASNDRAYAGLRNIERSRLHDQLLKEGKAALEKKDLASARLKLATLRTEDPAGEPARMLHREIDEQTALPSMDSSLAAAYRKLITIEFKDAPLKQVFEVISRSSGLNFIFDKDVKLDQKTSVFLKRSAIESVVHFTLLTNQLEQQVLDANTILIYPNTAAKLKDYQEMVVKSFLLANADAKVVANTLKTIVKSRDIVVDEKLNMVIVRDSPDAIKAAEKLVALHDVPEPEVMLEVEILEVKRTRLMELGIQWPSSLALTPLPSTTGGTLTLDDLRNVTSKTVGAGVGPTIIRARKEDGDANLLANPRIRARNHEKAKILIGERVPNITTTATATGFVSESVNYIDVGLKLDVEPTVYLDNDVAIKISLEVSSVTNQIKTQSGSIAYQIGTRTASTVLRLKDGENQVLAGLINDEDRRTGNKVPGLGELPILGRLFGSAIDDSQKTEIVLSITPHLIRNIQRPDAAMAEFRSGTDSSFRTRPDTITTTPGPVAPSAAPVTTAVKMNTPPTTPKPPTPSLAVPTTGAGTGGGAQSSPGATPDANAAIGGGIGNPLSLAAQAQWQGPASVKPGETFAVQLRVQSNQPVASMPMTIGFDSKTLQVVNVAEGIFLKQGGAQTTFTSKVDPAGIITLQSTRTGAGGATLPADGVTVNFRALAATDAAQIQLLSLSPTGPANQPIVTKPTPPLAIRVQP
ncbi:general secretion pathway protein GspD [Noviherbaspirillum cavernae]|uniref:General secretion pathway protein GspD n=1 Tax=Noviherbaspirillum cavernae TaxID=2320862 RepID=A0A418WYF5_9BURK|nr:secretin N-terminal domain-containing protein [Noviherbaspirillum cavernae]RJG05278.1 general secretion pathway protein GspD [Noviherbaspirillum cavernae]